MIGRPRRDPTVLRQLLSWEFQWQIVFLGLREGLPAWDTSLPTPANTGLKWLRSHDDSNHQRTADEKNFWLKHFREHIQEAEREFTEKMVLAEPRDLPAEPEIWRGISKRCTSASEIRRLCRQSEYLGRSRAEFRRPTAALYVHAAKFCEAKRDKRFPGGGRQKRKSSDAKRVDYLARVLAGLSMKKPMRPATAVDLLRKLKHKKSCSCWRCVTGRATRQTDRLRERACRNAL